MVLIKHDSGSLMVANEAVKNEFKQLFIELRARAIATGRCPPLMPGLESLRA